jgi:hypothetical protein
MEIKDLLETLDLGEVKDLDGFKKTFNEKFIPKSHIMEEESVKKAIAEKTGKTMGAITTFAKREFGLSTEEVEGKKWEDVFTLGLSKKKAEIDELKNTLGSGNDEKLTTLTTKLTKKEKEAEELKELLEKTSQAVSLKDQELAKKEDEFSGKIKSFKIQVIKEKAKEKVKPKLKSDLTEADEFFFNAKIDENFTFDFDEKETPLVFDKNGKRLQDPKKLGSFMDMEQALESLAVSLNLAKKNNGGSVDVKKIFGGGGNEGHNNNGGNGANAVTGRKLHPNAVKSAEMAAKR